MFLINLTFSEHNTLADSFAEVKIFILSSNKLLSVHQSGFRSSESYVNQLLSIVHKLYKDFDAYPTLETRCVFLDMFKAKPGKA